jgi:hypothetical protein
MRTLGRRTGWLGWVVAGVLLVSAGGAALAAQSATGTTQTPSAGGTADKANKARAGALGRGGGWRHALGRRVLHGEVTVQTREGVKTLVMARGQVTALSGDAITIRSSDGVETSFGIDGATRFGFRNQPAPSAELKVGEDALVAGEKSGDRATARRVVSGELTGAAPARPAARRRPSPDRARRPQVPKLEASRATTSTSRKNPNANQAARSACLATGTGRRASRRRPHSHMPGS